MLTETGAPGAPQQIVEVIKALSDPGADCSGAEGHDVANDGRAQGHSSGDLRDHGTDCGCASAADSGAGC